MFDFRHWTDREGIGAYPSNSSPLNIAGLSALGRNSRADRCPISWTWLINRTPV